MPDRPAVGAHSDLGITRAQVGVWGARGARRGPHEASQQYSRLAANLAVAHPVGGPVSFPERVRAHASSLSTELPAHGARNVEVIEMVNAQIRAADAQLRQIVKTEATCKALMTVPGVGPITAARFRAAIDDVSRFTSAHGVQSYLA